MTTFFNVVLIEPEIPQNTGNIGRTCVSAKCHLHLVGPLGFEITDSRLKRAGLDYWPHLHWTQYSDWDQWWSQVPDPSRVFFFSTKASAAYFEHQFQPGDWLVFGRETRGLDPEVLQRFAGQTLRIPMPGPVRSLNLATAAAVVVYEGLRQNPQLLSPP